MWSRSAPAVPGTTCPRPTWPGTPSDFSHHTISTPSPASAPGARSTAPVESTGLGRPHPQPRARGEETPALPELQLDRRHETPRFLSALLVGVPRRPADAGLRPSRRLHLSV